MLNQPVVIRVGIADLNLVKADERIRTSGLGSCVGVVLYDEQKSMGGMVHIMLPDSAVDRSASLNVAKYADTGVEALIDLLKKEGSPSLRLQAKIAGGAQMFRCKTNEVVKIGPRNVEAVKRTLGKFGIPLRAERTGGTRGRTIEFNPVTSMLTIWTMQEEPFEI